MRGHQRARNRSLGRVQRQGIVKGRRREVRSYTKLEAFPSLNELTRELWSAFNSKLTENLNKTTICIYKADRVIL